MEIKISIHLYFRGGEVGDYHAQIYWLGLGVIKIDYTDDDKLAGNLHSLPKDQVSLDVGWFSIEIRK